MQRFLSDKIIPNNMTRKIISTMDAHGYHFDDKKSFRGFILFHHDRPVGDIWFDSWTGLKIWMRKASIT